MSVKADALLRAVFYAQAAFETGDFAGFRHHLPDWVFVGAKRHCAFLIFCNIFEKSLRAFGNAEAAQSAIEPF